jgi:hypothetical protein
MFQEFVLLSLRAGISPSRNREGPLVIISQQIFDFMLHNFYVGTSSFTFVKAWDLTLSEPRGSRYMHITPDYKFHGCHLVCLYMFVYGLGFDPLGTERVHNYA